MPENGNGDLYESAFSRVYADIKRLDQLRDTEAVAQERLNTERDRRLDQRMDAQDKAVTAALAAAEKAVAAALAASEKANDKSEGAQRVVNETQNEFRGSLKDQAANLMPRLEAENVFRELRTLITAQSSVTQELRSRLDVGPPSLGVLQARSDNDAGRRGSALDNRALLFAVIAAIVAVGGFVIALTR